MVLSPDVTTAGAPPRIDSPGMIGTYLGGPTAPPGFDPKARGNPAIPHQCWSSYSILTPMVMNLIDSGTLRRCRSVKIIVPAWRGDSSVAGHANGPRIERFHDV